MSGGSKAHVLFKHKEATVTATVIGPRIGFEWTRINYVRCVPSTTTPGKFDPRPPDRECDQIHLQKCVNAVRTWYAKQERERAAAGNASGKTL